ncbi:uncharacterized protein LOC130949544 [Arachis stenosperma]|uniref:uncharacterized protein LOC130949544 n=1 Tax=Arachis stenosperma TaxID=217475 RepID=UPI0025AD5CC5|nr:uncharacterized protein LOC130949544 [Arachis stenosperma]
MVTDRFSSRSPAAAQPPQALHRHSLHRHRRRSVAVVGSCVAVIGSSIAVVWKLVGRLLCSSALLLSLCRRCVSATALPPRNRADDGEASIILLPSNITVLALDFSGSGISGGDHVTLGWNEKDDLRAVANYLRADENVSLIGLWGRSIGAVTRMNLRLLNLRFKVGILQFKMSLMYLLVPLLVSLFLVFGMLIVIYICILIVQDLVLCTQLLYFFVINLSVNY